jgi:hypothetical protein
VLARRLPSFNTVAAATAKKSVNVGRAGAAAGLDDYIYDAPEGDDFDFM